MKFLFKYILKQYLKYFSKLVLIINHPIIIVISGSTNKTFVKDAIVSRLKERGIKVRSNPKNFNTDIGLPLSILNLPSGYNEYKNWIPIIIHAPLNIFQSNFPNYLVLELGISDPGDMKHLLSIVSPDIAVITEITQRYLESFSDMDNLVDEYEYLVKKIKSNGLIILNKDNTRVCDLNKSAKSKVLFYGINNDSDYQARSIEKNGPNQIVAISQGNFNKKYSISRPGKHHIYAFLVGLIIENYAAGQK